MINSQILYFIETSPIREQIFNSYMDEAVMLYNEEFLAQAAYECGNDLISAGHYLNDKWLEMVRDN